MYVVLCIYIMYILNISSVYVCMCMYIYMCVCRICHIGQFHRVFSSQLMLTHFFMTLVELFSDV